MADWNELGQHVGGSLGQGPSEADRLLQGSGNAVAERLDQPAHQRATLGLVRFAVGEAHPLVDAAGGLDLDVFVGGEECLQALLLLVGSRSAPVCRVRRAA